MNVKRIISVLIGCTIMAQCISVFAYSSLSASEMRQKHHAFASQYKYKEGDTEKSFNNYPGIVYMSGIERTEDGTIYECPAIYVDEHAKLVDDFSMLKGNAKFVINGRKNQYFEQCVLYNSRLLIPVDAFAETGCNVQTNVDTYVTTISKGDITLEVLPYLIGMRKNQADGFYVPLETCARIVDDTLYVPVRAIANELGLEIYWNESTGTVFLNN